MNSIKSVCISPASSNSIEEEFLISKIVLTHDPDGRVVDSELLLQAVEGVMCSTANTEVPNLHNDGTNVSNRELFGSEETFGHIIYKILGETLLNCSDNGDLHKKTMVLFDILGDYTWGAKVVLILAAFATRYGEYLLIMQTYPRNPLAASVALLKQFPPDLSMLRIRFKNLSLLVNTMVEVTKCIIKFEGLTFKDIFLEYKDMALTKSQIYIATYWIFRSSLACFCQITDFRSMKHEKCMFFLLSFLFLFIISIKINWHLIKIYRILMDGRSDSPGIPIRQRLGISNLVFRLGNLCSDLRKHVELCHQQIETKLYKRLLNVFNEVHQDNQEAICMLFGDLPLKNCSSQAQAKFSELKNKVVIILISKPELLPIEQIHLLVQQTYDHPQHKNTEISYEVVWVPISSSDTWTFSEKRSFSFLSNSLPWLSIRKPWLLSSAVMSFIKQEWDYKEQQPLMVVLDSQGMISNINAIDMVLIWGAEAFPFSTSREKELWEEQNWSLQLLFDDIDPLLLKRVEEGRSVCIYGSEDLDWIRDFNSRMKKIKSTGLQLEVIYIGRKNPREFDKSNFYGPLDLTKINLFWLRLESMKRSILRVGGTVDNQSILKELEWLLKMDENHKSWVLIGKGNSKYVIKLQEMRAMEWLELFPVWGEKVGKFGLVGAIRTALEPPLHLDAPCDHQTFVPYDEAPGEDTVVCDKCRRLMEKFVLYKCDATE